MNWPEAFVLAITIIAIAAMVVGSLWIGRRKR